MTRTLTLETDIATVDSATAMTTQASKTPSRSVPSWAKTIGAMYASISLDGAADGGATFLIRITEGVKEGPHEIIVGAGGYIDVQAGADPGGDQGAWFQLEDLDIEVTGDDIACEAEMMGSDLGTAVIGVTFVFNP